MGKNLQESEELRICALQEYFTKIFGEKITHKFQDKIRDVMSGVLRSAVDTVLLIPNLIENVRCLAIAVDDAWHPLASPLSSSSS